MNNIFGNSKWIGSNAYSDGAVYFRKTFNVDKKSNLSTLKICGLGFYEAYINGEKTSLALLTPTFSQYDKTVIYDEYDVNDLIKEGENVISVIVGNGWYNSNVKDEWGFCDAPWRNSPRLILSLTVCDKTIITNEDFKFSYGAIVYNCLRCGEYYDATLEPKGWKTADFNDEEWENAKIVAPPGGILKKSIAPNIKVTKELKPRSIKKTGNNKYLYDFGENMSGIIKMGGQGKLGESVTFKYSELITPTEEIDTSNIDVYIENGEFQTDKYTFAGNDYEVWQPKFVYHGFRYVELNSPRELELTALVIHSDVKKIGDFQCSNSLLNKIYEYSCRSTLTNLHGFPTDCPHREKNGWTGDAQLSCEQSLFNFDMKNLYISWLNCFKDAQRPSGQLASIIPTPNWGYNWGSGPAWDCALILIPWNLYLYTNEKTLLINLYDNMKLYMDYVDTMACDYIVNFGLGDWCAFDKENVCPTQITDTAYYYDMAKTLSKIANVLNMKTDTIRYEELSEKIKEAFVQKFVDAESGKVGNGTQCAQSCALYENLVTGDLKEKVLEKLIDSICEKDFHITGGILCTKYILNALSQNDRHDIAMKIALQEDLPSFGYWIKSDTTTLCECWDKSNSQNHHMYSTITEWFFKHIAGINIDENNCGFKNIIIKPNFDVLENVTASHLSSYGKIEIKWTKEKDYINLSISNPKETTFELILPKGYYIIKHSGTNCYSNLTIIVRYIRQ